MKKIYDFVKNNFSYVFLAAALLALVFAAVTALPKILDPKFLGEQAANFIMPVLGTAAACFIFFKIIPNKKFLAGAMLFFGAVMALYMILNLVTFHFSGTLAAAPVCTAIFLMTGVKCME